MAEQEKKRHETGSHHSHHHHHHRRHRRRRSAEYYNPKKRALLKGLYAVGGLVLLALLYFGLTRLEAHLDKPPEGAGLALTRTEAEEAPVVYFNGGKYREKTGLQTLLILGIDDAEVTESLASRNTSQADFITLAVFDTERECCTLLQLNRDTMTDVPVPDGWGGVARLKREQLALAHTYGNGLEESCENTADAVSRLLYGVRIDNYFALTMDAIPKLNDLVGGVTVTVEDDFTGVDETLVKGETVRLTAENVENYVRARSNMREDSTNLNRMKRQRTYLAGLFEALRESLRKEDDFVLRATRKLEAQLVSDCTLTALSEYAERFADYSLGEIITPEGKAEKGERYVEFTVDEEALQKLVLRLFFEPAE